jgi:hypothetical protein
LRNQNLPTRMKFFKSLFASADSFTLDSASVKSFTESWPQIKAYYEILLKTVHDAEKGNLESIKSNSGVLSESVNELTIENLPAPYRNPKTIETLLSLKKQTKLVADLVDQNALDEEIKKALKKLKETFYNIVELCLIEK